MDEPKRTSKAGSEHPGEISSDIIRQNIKEIVKKHGADLPPEQKKELGKIMVKVFEKGMTPKEAMGVSEKEISEIYGFAYYNFSIGKFEEAKQLFKMMFTLDPRKGEYATCIGVCHHKQKEYEDAIAMYLLSSGLSAKDPVPLFYAYDCFKCLNQEYVAAMMLMTTIEKAGAQPQYAKLKQNAQTLLDALEAKLKNNPPELQKKAETSPLPPIEGGPV